MRPRPANATSTLAAARRRCSSSPGAPHLRHVEDHWVHLARQDAHDGQRRHIQRLRSSGVQREGCSQ